MKTRYYLYAGTINGDLTYCIIDTATNHGMFTCKGDPQYTSLYNAIKYKNLEPGYKSWKNWLNEFVSNTAVYEANTRAEFITKYPEIFI